MTAFTELSTIFAAFWFVVVCLAAAAYVMRSDNWDD